MAPLDLNQVLVVKPGLRIELLGSSVFMIGERARSVLADARTVHVAALVDGRRNVQNIVMAASPRVSEPETLYILSQLVARGYLVPAADIPLSSAAFWYGVGLDARVASETLSQNPVSVRSLGSPPLGEWMSDALEHAGLRIENGANVQVVVTDDYLRAELAEINREARQRSTSWFLVKATGTRPLIGPMFEPDRGPCWDCLAFWMRNDRPVEELVRRHTTHLTPVSLPDAALEASGRAACSLGAVIIAQALVCRATSAARTPASNILELDLVSFQTAAHAVIKRPQCPTCGDFGRMAEVGERPIGLRPVEKRHCTDGGYRSSTPRETFERYKHLVSPITGPVTHLVPMPGRNTELRAVYASGYLVCPRNEIPSTNLFDKVCAGKGRSVEQARVSALCEALERYSGVYQGDEARVRATKNELGSAAVALNDLLNFSGAQYRARGITGPGADPRGGSPEPLEASMAIDWTPAWSLSRQERRYIPLTYCYSEAPLESGTLFCQPCGNGVAAGTCLEEAILQGLLELIERDAVAIWWYNRICRPAIDIQSFGDSYFDALCADYARLGWKVWSLDLTHDLGITTCAAIAHRDEPERFAIGFGCHLEPRLALQRALTELNQLFEPEGQRAAPWALDRLLDREYLFPHPRLPRVIAEDLPTIECADLRADAEHCLHRLDQAGLELIVVDKTRPDIGLPVAQVIVPGLRHFWPRFGPGRLYSVPRTMGWLLRPLAESELNRVPLFV